LWLKTLVKETINEMIDACTSQSERWGYFEELRLNRLKKMEYTRTTPWWRWH